MSRPEYGTAQGNVQAMPSREVESLLYTAAPGWNFRNGLPQVVTYSFEMDGTGAFEKPWAPFNAAQQDATRSALAQWSAASGLTFVQVPDTPGGRGIALRFGLHELPFDYVGRAYFPLHGGDVALDLSRYGGGTGAEFTETLLHEIGHAIGLKHPFTGSVTLPYLWDNTDHTVMSYTPGPSGIATKLGPLDVLAARHIYGTPADKAAWPIRYSYDARLRAVRMDARPGDVEVQGTDHRDAVFATAGNNVIRAGAGDDLIYAGAGSNAASGGAGRDTLALGATRRQASLDVQAESIGVGGLPGRQGSVSAAGEATRFYEMERIAFIDGHFSYTAEDPDAQVARLYRAGLGRSPDAGGLAFWGERVTEGTSLVSVAQGFMSGPEFQARFGGLDDAGFVAQTYRNVLGREADPGGFSHWHGQVLHGGRSRAEVLVGLSESAENQRATASLVANGLWVQDPDAAAVARLYDTTLNRLPDGAGLASWSAHLGAGVSLHDVAARFIASPEFVARYGGLDSAGFVRTLYQNVLDRPGEPAGVEYWTGVLDDGRTDRAGVVVAFSESQEHRVALAPAIEDGILLA